MLVVVLCVMVGSMMLLLRVCVYVCWTVATTKESAHRRHVVMVVEVVLCVRGKPW
jgi:hypothetical protein